MPTPTRAFAAAALSLLFLTGCSAEVSVGVEAVPEAEIEADAAKRLAEQVNQPEPDIDCPGDLEAEVGAELDCILSVEGDAKRYPVNIKVTSVDEETEKVNFDVQVGDEPLAD